MKKFYAFLTALSVFSLISVETYGQASACSPTGLSSFSEITNVTSSGALTNINNSTGYNGYRDFTGTQVIQVLAGTSFNLSISHEWDVTAFIDWNNDGAISGIDQTLLARNGGSRPPAAQFNNISVPVAATAGLKRLRIASSWNTNPSFCRTSNGEFEDYAIEILPPASEDAVLVGTPTVNVCSGLSNYDVVVRNLGSNTLTSFTLNGTINNGATTTNFGPVNVTGANLAFGADTTITLGTYTYVSGTSYNLSANVSSPNGTTDGRPGNDSWSNTGLRPAMSGTFTVGTASSDFTDIEDALTDLRSLGVCDTVIMNIAAGTYTGFSERFDFDNGNIIGTSDLSPVIWQTDPSTITPANPTVSIEYSGELVEFDNNGHEYQIIRNMRLETTTSFSDVVNFRSSGNGNNAWFDNVEFFGGTSTTTSTGNAVISANGGDNVHVTNCTFTRGSHAIYESGGSSWTVTGNTINPMRDNAIELRGSNNHIADNEIKGTLNTGTTDNVYLLGGGNNVINNNIEYSNGWGSALYSGGQNDSIAGNFIDLTSTNTRGCYGIEVRGDGSRVYDNEVVSKNVRDDVYCYYFSGDEINAMNNKAISESTSGFTRWRGFYVSGDGTVSNRQIIANNLIHQSDPNFSGNAEGFDCINTPYTDYVHNTVYMEGNGFNVPGNFNMSSTANNQSVRNNIFINLSTSGYAIDMDNMNAADNNVYFTNSSSFGRFNFSTIGTFAQWQSTSSFDANSIIHMPDFFGPNDFRIFYDQVINDLGAPSPVSVDFEGEARNPLTPDPGMDEYQIPFNSVSLASIDGPVNPICGFTNQIAITVSNIGIGALSTFDMGGTIYHKNGTTTPLSLNGYNAGTIASKASKSVVSHTVSLPNGFEDGDSIVVFVDNPNGIGAGQDTIAKDDTLSIKMIRGLQGTFTVGSSAGADYNTIAEVSHLLDSNYAICDTVIFELENGTYTDGLTILDLLGSDATKPVIFRSQSGDASTVSIETGGMALTANNGHNYYFENISFDKTSTNGRLVELNNDIDNLNFIGCHFNQTAANTTSTNRANFFADGDINNLNIHDCEFNEGSYGIWVATRGGLGALDGAEVMNCTVTNAYYDGIHLENGKGTKVMNNLLSSNSSNGNASAIFLDGLSAGAAIEQNRAVSQSDWPENGIYMNNMDALANQPVLVANNAFKLGNPSTSNNFAALYVQNSNYVTVRGNTFAVSGTNGGAYGAYFAGGGGIKLNNNIFVNFGDGECIYISGGSNVTSSDYNNLYSPQGDFAHFNGGVADMNAWQNSAGFDVNSQNVDPQFYSGIDYRVCNIDLDGNGQPGTGGGVDVDGEMRQSTPDIGADEFTHPSQFTLGQDTTICKGDNVTLNAQLNAGSTTLWNNFSTTPSITVNQAGIYSAYVTNVCGTSIDSIEVSFSNPADVGNDTTLCGGEQYNLSAGVASAVRYNWSTGASSSAINVSQTGQYAVEVEDNIGCISSDTVNVYVSPVVDLGPDTSVCDGQTVTLNGNVGPGDYRWNDLDRKPVKFVSKKGTYSMVYVDPNSGCISEDSVHIDVISTPSAQFLYSTNVNGVAFTNTSVNGTTYAWDFGDNSTSTKMNPVHSYTKPGTYTVLLTATNQCASHTLEQEVSVSGFNATGIADINGNNGLFVYPNPNNGTFELRLLDVETNNVSIHIIDAQGKVVLSNVVEANGNEVITTVDAQELATGIYNLQVTQGDNVSTTRISIIK